MPDDTTVYKRDLEIDEHDLVNELAGQALLYMKYGEKAAELRAKRVRLQEKLSLIKTEAKKTLDAHKAEIETTIRTTDPANFDLDRMTEGAVQAILNTDEHYKEAQVEYGDTVEQAVDEYANMILEHSIMESAVEACAHRKSMLESMVKLYLGGYFGEPRVDSEEVTPQVTKASVTKQRSGLKKKAKGRKLIKRDKNDG
jgi:phage baseplate assembly protein W